MLTPVFPALAGTVNYFVVSFRSSPIVPWDLYSLRTAASVADNYTLDVSWRLYFVLMGFLWLAILGEKMRFPFGNVKKTPALRCSIFGTDVCFCQLCTDRKL